MEVRYNVTGQDRKRLVKAVETATGAKAKYLGMPSMAYEVDYFTITKDGTLTFSDRSDSEEVEAVLEKIAEEGFECEENANTRLSVTIPLDKVKTGNLIKILEAKGDLIKKALGIDNTQFEIKDDKIIFDWFESEDPDEIHAYTNFIALLCKMSKESVRINATAKEVGNEKYAFRCFLLRLGFIGAEYKTDRKILLRNLQGSSAFRDGGKDNVSE